MHPDGMRYGECLTFLLPECEGWLEKRSNRMLGVLSRTAAAATLIPLRMPCRTVPGQ
jgi:hypothetical protein